MDTKCGKGLMETGERPQIGLQVHTRRQQLLLLWHVLLLWSIHALEQSTQGHLLYIIRRRVQQPDVDWHAILWPDGDAVGRIAGQHVDMKCADDAFHHVDHLHPLIVTGRLFSAGAVAAPLEASARPCDVSLAWKVEGILWDIIKQDVLNWIGVLIFNGVSFLRQQCMRSNKNKQTIKERTSRTEFGQQMRSGDLLAYLYLNRLLNGVLSCPRCYFVRIQSISHKFNSCVTDGRTDGPTDRHTLL